MYLCLPGAVIILPDGRDRYGRKGKGKGWWKYVIVLQLKALQVRHADLDPLKIK